MTARSAGGGEPCDPPPGFWRPYGRRSHQAVRDTAETMMEVQDYKPPRKRHVHPENLSPDQRVRERGFQAGVEARRAGESRDSSHWHRIERERRTTLEDCGLAAFELGWDTAAQGAKP